MTKQARPRLRGLAFLVATICIVSGGSFLTTDLLAEAQSQQKEEKEQKAEKSPAQEQDLKHAFALSEAFKQVARAMGPSVVHIRVTQQPAVRTPQQQPEMPRSPFGDEFFRRFFGEDMPDLFEFRMPDPRPMEGQGSGVIVREDGYIITNYHVVANADAINVVLSDDREFEAEVIGTDPDTDLAVIKIDAETLPAAPFGDSDALEVGEWVLAIGSPFGLDQTVTAGIVSAKGRDRMGLANLENFIQTDAAINPGNSGGPLVNLYGELVGINTAISTRSGGYMGVGFAIPSNAGKLVFESILDTGSVKRGWLGIQMQPLTRELAESFGYDEEHGVLIADVLPDTPAAKAGLQDGDIVMKVDGTQMKDSTELLNTIAQRGPGDAVTMEVFRNGESREFTVTLGERDLSQVARSDQRRRGQPEPQLPNELGLDVLELTPELARRLDATGVSGVVVQSVAGGSLAAEEGIQPGDIITSVGGTEIASTDDFVEAVSEADLSEGLRMQLFRQGSKFFVFLNKK